MHIESLRYFVELSRCGSFYGAAKRLYISQQGLNKAISSLETELGVKLVERGKRGVRLTNSGEIFLEHAEALLAEYSDMLDDLYAESRYAAPAEAHITLHMTYYLAQISRPFLADMDVIDLVSLVEEPFQQVLEGAARSDGSELFLVDAYNGTVRKITSHGDLVFEPLLVSQLGVVWKDGSPLSGYRAIHREQLADYPLAVDSHREMMRLVGNVMEDHPLNNIRLGVAEPRMTLEYATTSNQVASTFDSFGFMLARESPNVNTEGLHFTPFSTPRSMCSIGFVYARGAKPNVHARHAISRLQRHLAERYAAYFERYPLGWREVD